MGSSPLFFTEQNKNVGEIQPEISNIFIFMFFKFRVISSILERPPSGGAFSILIYACAHS